MNFSKDHGVQETELSKAVKISVNPSRALGLHQSKATIESEVKTNAPSIERKNIGEVLTVGKNFQEARRFLAQAVESGTLDQSLVDTLLLEDGFLTVEGVLLDYKRNVPNEKAEISKLLKHIQAFHNTYGGYIVLGADEAEKDAFIQPFIERIEPLEVKRLKDLCREHFTSPVELQSQVFDIGFGARKWQIQIILIPKRSVTEPVCFKKDGAASKSGKPIFEKDQFCFRDGDNSIVAATSDHFRFVYGSRINPFLVVDGLSAPLLPVEGGLPDRDFICHEFIGREEVITQLYRWFSDDFSCVRVLAGEGGLGKTSIAFEFASEVAKSHLGNVDLIAWLTAKKVQFRALDNEYEQLTETHFSNSNELFSELATRLAATPEEIEAASGLHMPRLLKKLIKEIKVFAVIDDLDSLEIDEQKRCIEVCQQLSGEGSRFLFTTRKNATASSSTAIELQGLNFEDYQKFVNSWEGRLKFASLSAKNLSRFFDASNGSPLYTESLLRLIKSGIQPNDAIAKWKGALGIEVRNAALKREVLQLGGEARRALVTAAIFGECSYAEIKQATEFSDQTLIDCLHELQSLFLISAPALAGQPRFGISGTTRELVRSLGPELLPGYSAFEQATKASRFKTRGSKNDMKAVGAAINQAMALIASHNPDQALKTVDEVNLKFGGKNHDLLFMRARALLKHSPKRVEEARRAFKQAFAEGQRKLRFFELWFETEVSSDNYEVAITVSTGAIESGVGEKPSWLMHRAHCRIRAAAAQSSRGDTEYARGQLENAARDLHEAKQGNPELEWDNIWKEHLFNTHDSLWALDVRSGQSIPDLLAALDGQLGALERGDHRIDVYLRLPIALGSINAVQAISRPERSGKERNLMEQSTKRCISAFKGAPQNLRLMRAFSETKKIVEHYGAEYRISM